MDQRQQLCESQTASLHSTHELDYYDSRSIQLPTAISPVEAWNLMTADSGPILRAAFWARDAISSLFGVKKIRGFSGQQREVINAGDRLDFFVVEHSSPEMLILAERDRHFDVVINLTVAGQLLTVTATVVTFSTFGRIYMMPVGIAHRLIVHRMLKRLRRELSRR